MTPRPTRPLARLSSFDARRLADARWARPFFVVLLLAGLGVDGLDARAQTVTDASGATPSAAPPPAPATPRFKVHEFVVEGNTVLDALAIERAVAPFLGPAQSFEDVDRARAALEKTYQDAGYLTVSVEIPQQRVGAGPVTLRVVEGSVEKLRVAGSRYHLPSLIRAAVPSLSTGSVPQFSEVQSELAGLGRQADRRVTPMLRPGKAPGKVEVELKVDDELPLHGSVEANNKQSANTERGRVEAAIHYDNLFQRGHSVGLQWIVAPTNRDHADILTATYGLPRASGDYLNGYVTRSDSDTPAGVGGSTVVKGTSFGGRYRFALPTHGGAYAHGFTVGFDRRDNRDDLLQSGLVVKRSLIYTAFAARYDQVRFDTGDGVSRSFDANLSLGIRGLSNRTVDCDGTPSDQFACKRFNARPNFMAWRAGLNEQRPLWGRWVLRSRLEAQWTNEPLVSQEQYGLGGVDTVRGYYEYEQFGDRGALARLELASPPVASLGELPLRGAVFAERGQVWLVDALPGEQARTGLAGMGVGLRAEGKSVVARLDLAVPMIATRRTERRDPAIHASLKLQF